MTWNLFIVTLEYFKLLYRRDCLILLLLSLSDDETEGRSIRIPKNGTLNIYIALDVSESIEKEYVRNATLAIDKLIKKVR